MVAAQESQGTWIPEFEGVQVEQALRIGLCASERAGRWRDTCLDAKAAAIDVVSEEQVVGFGELAADLEGLHKVVLHVRRDQPL